MLESFGARVTSAVSGSTTHLLVGKDPGFSKVTKARGQPRCELVSLLEIGAALHNGTLEKVGEVPVAITSFSAGFGTFCFPCCTP